MGNMYHQWIKNPVAYCTYHLCVLTERDIENHRCMQRHCGRLRRLDHPYWERRKERAKMRAERERKRKEIWGK